MMSYVRNNLNLLLVIGVEVFLCIWTSLGNTWYFYIVNFLILFVGSSIFNTAMVQGVSRAIYIIKIFPGKSRYLRALGLNTLTLLLVLLSFWIVKHSLLGLNQFIIFYGACSIASIMQLRSRLI